MSSEAAAITGRLEETSLFDLCHLLLPRRGCLIIERPEALRGKVWLSTGSVLDAQVRTLVGYDAFMEIARWHVGKFQFLTRVEMPQPAIESAYSKLSLDAALYVDLWNNLSVWNISDQTPISRHGYRASKEHEVFITQDVVNAWNALHGPMPVGAVLTEVAGYEGSTRLDALNALHHLLSLGVVRPEVSLLKPTPRVVTATPASAPAAVPTPTARPTARPTSPSAPGVPPVLTATVALTKTPPPAPPSNPAVKIATPRPLHSPQPPPSPA